MARLVKSIVSGSNVTGLGETTSSDQLEGRFAVEVAPLTDAANISVDFGANQNFSVTLATGTARTLDNPSNIVVGQTGSFFISQDGTGNATLSYDTYYDFVGGTAPTITAAANAVDRIDYVVRTTTSIHCVHTANYS